MERLTKSTQYICTGDCVIKDSSSSASSYLLWNIYLGNINQFCFEEIFRNTSTSVIYAPQPILI